MKNNFKTTTQLLVGVAAIGILSASVFAWTAPTQAPTAGNVPAPVNTGASPQTKSSSLSVIGNLTASQGVFGQLVNGARGVFGCLANCSTDTNVFRAGKHGNQGNLGQGIAATLEKGLVVNQNGIPSTVNAAFWVSLLGNTGSLGRNVMTLLISDDNVSSPNQENNTAVFQTNAERFSLYNIAGNAFVGLTAKNIRLTDGAAAGKVLTSDANGYASWADSSAIAAPAPSGDNEYINPVIQKNASGLVTGSCPITHPVMISAGGQCGSTPGQIKEIFVSFIGEVGSPGNMSMRCTEADQGVGQAAPTATLRPVCMKPAGLQVPVGVSWYAVSKTAGSIGQSCQSWLNGYPNFNGNAVDVKSEGTLTIGNANPLQNGSVQACAYVKIQNNQTYCKTGTFATAVAGYAPTANCVGIEESAPNSSYVNNLKTYIRY